MKYTYFKRSLVFFSFLALSLSIGVYALSNDKSRPQESNDSSQIIKTDIADYAFTVQRSVYSGDRLVFDIMIHNNAKDRDVIIYSGVSNYSDNRKTRLIDRDGNEYLAGFIQMGDQSADSDKGQPEIRKTIPADTSMKLTIVFRKTPSELSFVTLLEICFFNIDDQKGYKAQLRNVPISK